MRKLFTVLAFAAAGMGMASAYTVSPATPPKTPPTKGERCYPNGKIKPDALKAMQKEPRFASPRAGVISPDAATYFCGFDTEADMQGFTIHNVNDDLNLWHWQSNSDGGWAVIGYNSAIAMDDWLVSPAFHLEAGKRYILTIDAACSSSNYPEKIEMFVGKGTDVADATERLMEATEVANMDMASFGGYFTPSESGDYHLMLHGISVADRSTLMVDNFRVSSPDAVGLPGEDAIAYNENVLYEADFSQVPGTESNPVKLEEAGHYLTGLEGWRGLDCYGIGGAVMVDYINQPSQWAQLAPPKVQFTPTADGVYNGRIEVEAKVTEWSDQAKQFNNYEGLMFTGMVGSSQCPNGWSWGGNDSDFTGSMSNATDWVSLSSDVKFSGSKDLIDDDFDKIWDMVMLGSYPLDNIAGRITSLCGSNLAVRSYKVIEKTPVLPAIPGWETTSYSADGFTIKWAPIEGAERYVAILFEGDSSGKMTRLLETKVVSGTECSFDVATSDGRMLYVKMYCCTEDIRSPYSPTFRVFQVNKPSFGPLAEPVDGKLDVPFSWDPATHAVEVYALAGKKNAAAVEEYVINEFSFADYQDYNAENDENAPYTTYLDEPGWSIYPLISFSSGAAMRNNTSATWGMVDYMTVAGDCAYDFSEIEGKVKVRVTALTSGSCTMKAQLMKFDDVDRYYKPVSSDSKDLSTAYQTLEFELDPQGEKNLYIWITTNGQDTNYIKDVKVTCNLPAGATFLRPIVCGALDVKGATGTSGKFSVENIPADATKVVVTGQAYRALYEEYDGEQLLVYNARSPYATNADIEIGGKGDDTVQMPYSEGFDNAEYTSGEWLVLPVSGETATVELVSYDPTTGLYPNSSKRDKGFLRVENDKAGTFYLMTPQIEVAPGMDNAKASWYYFRNPAILAEGMVQLDGGDIESDTNMNDWGSDAMDPSWTSVSSSGWPAWGSNSGKKIRFGWKVTTDGEGGVFCVDNFSFALIDKYDLGLVRPHATPSVKPGEKLNASVEVGVYGELTTTKFNVVAYLDGEKVGEVGNPDRGPWGERRTVCEFDVTLPEDIALGEHEMKYVVNFEGDYAGSTDGDLSNNTASVKFNVVKDYLVGATSLKANESKLTWNVPAKGDRFTDDVESHQSFDDGSMDVVYDLHPIYDYDVFARSYGNSGSISGYKVIDVDQKPTIADANWTEQCVPNVHHLMACTVADFTVETEGFEAASGQKALLFWSNADGTESDNYLVLPQLNAGDRKVSFKARAYDSDCPEKIEIMTSSTGNAAEDFTAAATHEVNSSDYKNIEFEAPAGAKYVAIHHVSDEGFGLVIDDLTYAMEPVEVTGYNVYKDGELLTTVTAPAYEATADGNYSVSVVYPDGESAQTAPVFVSVSGIESVDAEADSDAVYYNLQGIRVDNPGEGVYVKVTRGKAEKVLRK